MSVPGRALPPARVALLAAPAAAGLLAAGALALQAPTSNLFMETRLWVAVGAGGLVLSGLLAVAILGRLLMERARAEGAGAAVEAAAREHRRFLLRLDHELKNPVTAIQAGLANLASELAATANPGAPAPGALRSVAAQAGRLADLVGELRKLAELETRPLERAPVDLAEMLTEVHEAALELPGADERVITLTLPQAPWPLGTIPGDRDLLFLAIHNLLVNAVKFTRPGDRVEVRARDEGDEVVVEVADTGIGIPEDEVGQIWDELARGAAAAGTPGSGLGLALARVIIRRHDGSVWVRSRAGDGTVVGVRLPAT